MYIVNLIKAALRDKPFMKKVLNRGTQLLVGGLVLGLYIDAETTIGCIVLGLLALAITLILVTIYTALKDLIESKR